MFPAKSWITCRHAPHGETNSSESVAIAMALKLFSDSETALNRAVRSAQIVRLKELDSMLQPE